MKRHRLGLAYTRNPFSETILKIKERVGPRKPEGSILLTIVLVVQRVALAYL